MEERKTAFLPREFSVTLKSVFVPSDSHVPVEVHAPAGMQIANAPGVPKPILFFPLFSRSHSHDTRIDSKMMDRSDREQDSSSRFRFVLLSCLERAQGEIDGVVSLV